MPIVQPTDQRTYMQTAAGLFDISRYLTESYPLQTARYRAVPLHNRDHPYKKAVSIDLAYIIEGLFMDDAGRFAGVRTAFRDGEKVKILCTQTDALHYWLAEYLMPTMEPQADDDFFPFNTTAESTGADQAHGALLDGIASQAVTDVPEGAQSLILIKDAGTLTSVRLNYLSGGTTYRHIINSPDEGIHMARLQTQAGTPIPAARSSGTMSLVFAPGNATFEIDAGYGELL